MNIEQQIFSACQNRIRNFSEAEKAYIVQHQNLINRLISWYQNHLSDGCWTAGNLIFIRQLAQLWPLDYLFLQLSYMNS